MLKETPGWLALVTFVTSFFLQDRARKDSRYLLSHRDSTIPIFVLSDSED